MNVIDRRERPSHGYRAVHVVVTQAGKAIEVQVRTELQHLWAEVSEKLSDTIDPMVKYGGGGERVQEVLTELALAVTDREDMEIRFIALDISSTTSTNDLSDELRTDFHETIDRVSNRFTAVLNLFKGLLKEGK